MELRLSEALIVLALSERTGTIPQTKKGLFKYGLAASVLQELEFQRSTELDGEIIKIINQDPLSDPILDEALQFLAKTHKNKKVKHWVGKLAKKSKNFQKILLNDLLDKGIVKKREEKNWWAFSNDQYELWADWPVKRTMARLKDTIFHGRKADDTHMALIGLICACRLYRQVFKDKEERTRARKKIKELAEHDVYKKGIRSTINGNRVNVATSILTIATGLLKEC
jgi:hypothetical protein